MPAANLSAQRHALPRLPSRGPAEPGQTLAEPGQALAEPIRNLAAAPTSA